MGKLVQGREGPQKSNSPEHSCVHGADRDAGNPNSTELKWEHIDFEKKTFFLRKEKTTDNITQPMSADAFAIIEEQKGLAPFIWVFPSNKSKGHIVELRDDSCTRPPA